MRAQLAQGESTAVIKMQLLIGTRASLGPTTLTNFPFAGQNTQPQNLKENLLGSWFQGLQSMAPREEHDGDVEQTH